MSEPDSVISAVEEYQILRQVIGDLPTQLKRVENHRDIMVHDIREQFLALRSLYSLLDIVYNQSLALPDAFREILDLVPASWQFPDETSARITLDGNDYRTSNFIVETQWRHSAEIVIDGQARGLFEVFYMEEKPPNFNGIFMWESPDLLKSFAGLIGFMVTRKAQSDMMTEHVEQAEQIEQHYAERLAENIAKFKKIKAMADTSIQQMTNFIGRLGEEMCGLLDSVNAASGAAEGDEPVDPSEMKHTVDGMQVLAEAINDYSLIKQGRLHQTNSEFSLRDVVERSAGRFYHRARRKGIDLIIFVDALVPDRVVGDSEFLNRILSHLVENAIDRTETGEIVVRAEMEATVHLLPIFRFRITDTAATIPRDALTTIFNPFAEDLPDACSASLSCRLGLSIARELVEMMGGEIWVDGPEAQNEAETNGNTFHFTMWMDIVKSADSDRPLPEENEQMGQRVLILTPQATAGEIYARIFENWGLDPHVVADADDALKLIDECGENRKRFTFTVIDTGDSRPGECPFLAGLRDREEHHKMPAVMLVPDMPQDTEREADEFNVAAILPKPIRQAALHAAVADAIKRAIPQVDAPEEPGTSETAASEPAREAEPPSPDGKKILIARSDDSRCALALKLLRRRGYAVTHVTNGDAAMTEAAEHDFDLAFIDIRLSGIGGIQVGRTIAARLKESGRHMPMIALIAAGENLDDKLCRDAGMDDCISNELNLKELVDIAEKFTTPPTEPEREPENENENTPEIDVSTEGILKFDREKLAAVTGGDPDMILEIIEIFEEDCPVYLSNIENAVNLQRGNEMLRAAECLQRDAENVGAMAVAKLSGVIAELGRGDNAVAARPVLQALREEFAAYEKLTAELENSSVG